MSEVEINEVPVDEAEIKRAANRRTIGDALRALAESVESGEVRALGLMLVNAKGGVNQTFHVEEGTSEAELLGLPKLMEVNLMRMMRGGPVSA